MNELNAIFGCRWWKPSGKAGGGAVLTDLDRRVVGPYRDIERASAEVLRSSLEALQAKITSGLA